MEMSQTNSDDMVKSKRSALHKRALTLARPVQGIVIFLTIGLFIASISVHYKSRSIVCRNDPCPPGQLTYKAEQALSQAGMTVDSLVIATITLDLLVAAVFTISAVIISVRKPRDLFAIFTSVMLVTFGVATFSGGIRGFGTVYPSLHGLIETIIFFGSFSFVTFLFTFPNSKFRPRWAWLIPAAWTLFQIPRYYLPDSPLNIAVSNRLFFNVLFSAGVLSAILTQVYRYVKVSNEVEKQQTKWVIYGMTVGIVGYLTVRILSLFIPDPFGNGILINILSNIAATIFILLVPLSITIAITRYRLWNIDPIINRTLVYGTLSFLTIAFYILVVGRFAIYFRSNESNLIISFIATGVVAILFEPLRQRLQQGVNRLMYGERDDPATVLTRLSQQLESALAPESILQTIVETLAATLRLPYAAISLLDEEPRFTSTLNLPPSGLIHFPLTNQTERIGELILAPRSQGESFSPADMKLIIIIAQQAGVVAHAVHLTQELRQLNADLQQSREQLVTAREEERRRIRRDLHDGVGPILASLLQRLDTVRILIPNEPGKAASMAEDLKGQVKTTIADIRRLVYALRPPVLDELGLVSAIREYTADYQGASGLQVNVIAPETLPHLPAAVEVAAYRIVLEAFANVVHHAQATTCHISMSIAKQENDSMFFVEIADNGQGLPVKLHAGVGIVSMRERVAELGGSISIKPRAGGGTHVRACLPFSEA